MIETNNNQIEEYYDEYVSRQVKSGINRRHKSIADFCQNFCGMNAGSNILEVGCGVGTATTLLADIVTEGTVLAIDISSKSVEEAKKALGNRANVSFMVSDMTGFNRLTEFDLIVMPDVIEHIPIEQHAALFEKLERSLVPGGKIMVHIPDPDYSDYIRQNQPELLQIVDQSLRFNDFVNSLSRTALDVIYWERYSVFKTPFDYRRIVLEKSTKEERSFISKQESLRAKLAKKITRFWKNRR